MTRAFRPGGIGPSCPQTRAILSILHRQRQNIGRRRGQVLPEAAVLSIFWTLAIIGPMSDEGRGVFPAAEPKLAARCHQRVHKESSQMKRAIFSCLTVVILAGLAGCITQHGRRPTACMSGSCAQAPETCQSCEPGASCDDPCDECECRGHGCHLCRRAGRGEVAEAPAGPAVGGVTYPYYTNRGPRDFLAKNPPSIGP